MEATSDDALVDVAGQRSALDALGIEHNTDKASRRVEDGKEGYGHDLLRHYEAVLSTLKTSPATILDLGVGMPPDEFASAKVWVDYYPSARVVAVDIREPTVPTPDGIQFVRGDLGDMNILMSLVRNLRPEVVVEDASHLWRHQFLSLFYLLPAMAPGGVYIWEDLQVSRSDQADGFKEGLSYSPADFLTMLSRELVLYRELPRPTRAPFEEPDAALPEMMAASLASIIDRITLVSAAAIIQRRA